MSLEAALALVILVALVLYALSGGADYGGGVWDLLASGPRADRQRQAIERAIGPIWEADHVWLILVVVLLFTAFPPAFAEIMTALHVPVAVMLVGIVLRGSSFVFRTYDSQERSVQRRWGRLFAVSSVVTPVLLGVVIGAISTPEVGIAEGVVQGGFLRPWLRPFPFAVGFFALAQFAFLAATYLTVDADEAALRDDFRRRALAAAVVVGVMAATVLLLSDSAAPHVRQGLVARRWSIPLHMVTAAAAVGAIVSLWARRWLLARLLAAAQVSLILLGWGLALNPYLLASGLTIRDAAAPPVTLRLVLWALAVGSVVLFPAFYYLYRTFKGGLIFAPLAERHHEEGDRDA